MSLLLRVWDLESGLCVRLWRSPHSIHAISSAISSVAFDGSSTLVASGGASDHCVKVWDVNHGHCTHNFKGHTGLVNLVQFHPDPNHMQLFSTSEDCSVRVWDLIDRSCIVLLHHMSTVTSMAFSKSGWNVFTAGRDKVIGVWDLRDTEAHVPRTIVTHEALEGIALVTCTDRAEPCIATCGERGLVRIWDMQSGLCILEEQQEQQEQESQSSVKLARGDSLLQQMPSVGLMMFDRGRKMIKVNADYSLFFYALSSINQPLYLEKVLIGNSDDIIDLHYLPPLKKDTESKPSEQEEQRKTRRLAVATNSEYVRVFDMENGAWQVLFGHSDIVICLDVFEKDRLLVTGSKDATLRIWDTESLRCLCVCVGHTEAVGAVGFAKRGNLESTFFVSGSKDKTLKLWEIRFTQASSSAKESNDIRNSISSKARFTQKAHEKDINSLAVSPDDKIVASGSQDKTIKLWNTQDLSLLSVLKGHKRGIWCVVFSPVDKCLASASSDRTIKLWSLNDYTCLKTFEGHSNSVLKVAFLTRGMQLISSGSDGLLKLWTIKSNECVNTFDAHTEKVWALAVSKEEDEIVSGGADSLINIWRDYTKLEEEQKTVQNEQRILVEQELENSLRNKNYKRAIEAAFSLEQPFRMLAIFEQILDSGQPKSILLNVFSSFTDDKLEKLLSYIRDWNTNAKHCVVAQNALWYILSHYHPALLKKIPNVKQLLDTLIPYTDRHFHRIDRLLQKSFLIDYTLKRMNGLLLTHGNIEEPTYSQSLSLSLGNNTEIASDNNSSNPKDIDNSNNKGNDSSSISSNGGSHLYTDESNSIEKKRKINKFLQKSSSLSNGHHKRRRNVGVQKK